MKRLLVLAAAVVDASSVGCANARYVQKSLDEGIVAVPSNTDAWPDYNRTNALKLIEAHVGPAYDIIDEGEVKTGTATTKVKNTDREATLNPTLPGVLPAEKQTTTTTTTARDLTEYQIHYRKKAGGLTGFPGTGVTPAGGVAAPAGGGVVPAQYTTPPAGTVGATPQTVAPAAQAGALPPPNLAGVRPQ